MFLALRALPAGLVLSAVLWLGSAQADDRSRLELPGDAFVARTVCPLDPFTFDGPERLADRLRDGCRLPDLDRGRTALEATGHRGAWRLEQQFALEHGSLAAHWRWRLKAIVDGAADAVPLTAQGEVAFGLWWQPTQRWALRLRHGLRRLADRSTRRTELTGAWLLAPAALLYGRVVAQPDGAVHSVGLRWWLVPGQLRFDLALPATGADDPPVRMRLSWPGFSL